MKVLLLGGAGQVGLALRSALAPLGEVVALGRTELDLYDIEAVRGCVRAHAPQVMVNAAAYTAVDRAESEPAQAFRVNAEAVGALAQEAAALGALLVHYSTDYVFDGCKDGPYVEEDVPRPLNVYGESKLRGEEAVRTAGCDHLILRTGWVYSARGTNFPNMILRLARERGVLRVVDDQFGAPTPAWLLAQLTVCALRARAAAPPAVTCGTYHASAAGRTSWKGYAVRLLELARGRGMPLRAGPEAVVGVSSEVYGAPARRPRNGVLCSNKIALTLGVCMPDWRGELERFLNEVSTGGDGA